MGKKGRIFDLMHRKPDKIQTEAEIKRNQLADEQDKSPLHEFEKDEDSEVEKLTISIDDSQERKKENFDMEDYMP